MSKKSWSTGYNEGFNAGIIYRKAQTVKGIRRLSKNGFCITCVHKLVPFDIDPCRPCTWLPKGEDNWKPIPHTSPDKFSLP